MESNPPATTPRAGDGTEPSSVHHSSFSIHPSAPPLPALARPAKRLHPLTLLFTFWNAVRSVVFPAIVVLFFSRGRERGFWWVIVPLAFATLSTLYTLLHYFTFSYRIAGGELVIRRGVLQRTERQIPLSRVQDVRMTQGVMHRLFRVFDVEIETAGGGKGEEASLSVLSHADAEELRAAVFAERHAATGSTLPSAVGDTIATRNAPAVGSPTSSAPSPPREILRTVSLRELVLAGMTSNRVGAGLAILGALYAFLHDLLPGDYEQRVRFLFRALFRWLDVGGASPLWALKLLALLAAIFLLSVATSVTGAVIAFHGFTLSRSGEDLHRTHGLFTRRASSLPRRRIQLLKIQEGLLRRLFGLASLHANTAGSVEQNQESHGLDALLPPVPRRDIDALLPTIFPDLPATAPDWRHVSRRAIRRATIKGAIACALLAMATCVFRRDATGLWFFALLPPIYLLNVLAYKHLGYALDGDFFRTRRGVWSRSTHLVPVRNVQTVLLTQSPFDRRHGVMKIVVDTAGQGAAGTGPEVSNVPSEHAHSIAQTLAARASRTRYRW